MTTFARCSNLSSIAMKFIILLSFIAGVAMSAPVTSPPPPPSAAELNATYTITQMKNGMEVLRRVHEGTLFSVLRDEGDNTSAMETSTFSLNDFTAALNLTCALRDAQNNLWSLDGVTGEQPDASVRLLRYTTNQIITLSCEWTKAILSQLYPKSVLHLQCTWEEVDHICDEFNSLTKAKTTLRLIETYNPTVSGEIDWIVTNLPKPDSSTPLLQRFVHYVHNEPLGL